MKSHFLVLHFLFAFLCGSAIAAPGAHGPGGEHLQAGGLAEAVSGAPRVEASTDEFELVARLGAGELSILVDRYATNEPVLGAEVTVQFGNLKAKAAFHADHGDYSANDPALLKALSAPGEHALIFTVVAGKDTDLIDANLIVGPAAAVVDAHANDLPRWLKVLLAIAVLHVAAGLAYFILKRTKRNLPQAALLLALFALAAADGHAAPGAHGPGGEHLDAPGGSTASGLARLPDGSVNLPKSAQRWLEIRTAPATLSDAAATAKLSGRVVMDPNAGGRVQASLGGRVEAAGTGLPVGGQKVVKGQVLAYVRYLAEPFAQGNQQAQLSELRANRTMAEQKVKRLESLEGTVPRKEIESARIELEGLIQRERGVGASLGSREAMLAPVSGVVARANVVLGQVVEARDVLFEIIDPARILIEAPVADVAFAERIASGHLQGHPGVGVRVIGIGRSLRDGVLPVTFRVDSPGAKPAALAVGQSVEILAVFKERIAGIVLPASAIARSPSNEPIVWVKAGAERYVPAAVQFQPLDSQTVLVTKGLAPDNRVVVQGAGLLSQIR